ncbi:MAG: fibronectin type III domain-containing protein [Roseburia sp.]|nr:fibronectin type III domain-containing protein [Roseburia sp.]
MKNYVKAIVTFVFLMAAIAFVPNVADAAVKPGTPGNLRQTDADTDYVKFTWDIDVNADDYQTSYSTDGANWSDWDDVDSSWYGTTKTIYKLSAGSTYYVKVRSVDNNGTTYDYTDDTYGADSEVLEVVTAPSTSLMEPVQVTATQDTSLSLSWNAAYGATSYELKNNYANDALYLTTAVPSATITGLAPGTWYGIDIYPVRTSSKGYKAYSGRVHNYLLTSGQSLNTTNTGTVTAPATPSTANFGTYGANSSALTLSFWAKDPNYKSNGYEVEVRKIKGNKKVASIDSTSTYSRSIKVSKNTPYKYRVRLYAVSNGTKLYSGWSSYRHFCIQKISGKRHYNTRSKYATIKLNWGKVTGASGYTIYMSTSRDGKYKKVKSLGKNAKSVTLKKYGKSRLLKTKTYYIKVVPKVKDGKKTIKNDTQVINYAY